MYFDEVFGNPIIHPESFVSSRASVIGLVTVEENVIIAPAASVRADEGTPFRICKGVNIQDGTTIHGLFEKYVTVKGVKYSVYIGSHCSIAHGALVHGPAMIGKKTFVGFYSQVNFSTLGSHCYIGSRAVVEGVEIAEGRYVPTGAVIDNQKYADRLPSIPPELVDFNREVVEVNKRLVLEYTRRREKINEQKMLEAQKALGQSKLEVA